MSSNDTWTLGQLRDELERWEELLRSNGYPDSTIQTYVGRSELFLRWLAGEWQPTGPRDRR